jgi:hypothetical protein
MKNMKFILLGFIILSNLAYSQHLFTFSGYVVDEQNGEAIIGATIADSSLNYAVTSNDYGFFSLTIPAGEHQFFCSFIGYEILNFTLKLDKNIIKTIKLNQGVILLNQVTITADNLHDKINQNNFNVEKITIQSIKHQPAIFGEIDIIKSVQNQTGVKTIGDGSSAMYIRGGNSDQNLILIDEAPIYNPSHLFGLVSVFNPMQ